MQPAERVPTDIQLAGVIADNRRIAQKLMHVDAALQRAWGRDQRRLGVYL